MDPIIARRRNVKRIHKRPSAEYSVESSSAGVSVVASLCVVSPPSSSSRLLEVGSPTSETVNVDPLFAEILSPMFEAKPSELIGLVTAVSSSVFTVTSTGSSCNCRRINRLLLDTICTSIYCASIEKCSESAAIIDDLCVLNCSCDIDRDI